MKDPAFGTAIYKCQACQHVWSEKPGPLKDGCPKCKHNYVRWINFDQWQKEYEEHGKR